MAKHKHEGTYIKSVVYGGVDGIITTFAVVSGVTGASLHAGIILILGFANLIADGISMATADYLSSKAERDMQRTERRHESLEIRKDPEAHKKDMIEHYVSCGMAKRDAVVVVEKLSRNKVIWTDLMLAKECSIVETTISATKSAWITFASFVGFGFVPLFAYVLARYSELTFNAFVAASILTGITLFALGAYKAKITELNWLKSGFQTLLLGGVAAGAAYLIGFALAGIIA